MIWTQQFYSSMCRYYAHLKSESYNVVCLLSVYNSPIYHSCISLFPDLFHCFDRPSWSASFPGRPKIKTGRKPGNRQSTMAQKERPNNVQQNNGISQEYFVLFFSIILYCSRTIWYVIFHNQNKYCLNNIYVLLVSAIHKSKNRNGVSQSN